MNVEQEVKEEVKEELVTREEIKDSPFVIVGIDGEFFGTMGKYRITEPGSKAEVKKELKGMSWNRIVQVVLLLIESTKEVKL